MCMHVAGQRLRSRLASERGVSIIQVAVVLLVLMGVSAFVFEGGAMYMARREAQNAADAGALAGAVARIFDDTGDSVVVGGAAYQSALIAARANPVLSEQPGVAVFFSPETPCPAFSGPGKCVRVDVHRDGSNGSNALPTFFSNAFNIVSVNVRATATAKLMPANANSCLKPWMIPDKFTDVNGNGQFDLGEDSYTNPGYRETEFGETIDLRPASQADQWAESNYFHVYLDDDPGGGLPALLAAMRCVDVQKVIGEQLTVKPGNAGNPEMREIEEIIAEGGGSEAYVDDDGNVHNCTAPCDRLGYIATFDPEAWATQIGEGPGGGNGTYNLTIVNIIAVFITDTYMERGPGGRLVVRGVKVRGSGQIAPGGQAPAGGSFMQAAVLIR